MNVPNSNTAQYQISIYNQQQIECFYIPSHRSISKYQKINNIPLNKKTKEMAFVEVSNATKQRFNIHAHEPDKNSFFIKETLINWAIQGYGNQVIIKDQELIDNYEGFKVVLKKILPKTLGFESFEIRNMEIVFYL